MAERVLFLDIDGVLNRTGYRPEVSLGLRSWVEPDLARRANEVLQATGAVVVLSSDWRRGRDLAHLQGELAAAGLPCRLVGTTPVLGRERWREIEAWLTAHAVPVSSVAIVDDGYDMGPLAARFVRVSPLTGFDDDAAARIRTLLAVQAPVGA